MKTNSTGRLHRLVLACLLVMVMVITTAIEPVRAQEDENNDDSGGTGSPPLQQESDAESASGAASATGAISEKSSEAKKEEQQFMEGPGKERIKRKEVMEDKFDASSTNWGSYYDPQNIFCGKYDCYKILGFDYDSFGKNPPDSKVITKRYRKLSREWHPDKSKRWDAKERFVKISQAYKVLTDPVLRKEYDSMRFDQELYFSKYGTSVLWSYAPKSDVTLVVILILIIAHVFAWLSQLHRWQLVANRLIKAAVEDWTTSQGGTPESKELREQALAILYENNNNNNKDVGDLAAASAADNNNNLRGSKKQKGVKKVTGRDKKKLEEEALLPIVKALVKEMHDFGGGFHKPTWRDLLIVTLAKAPIRLAQGAFWNAKYFIRRLQKIPLSDEEQLVLTQRAVGPAVWDTKSDEERQEMIKRQLWVLSNLAEWEDERNIKNLSNAEQKQYAKLKKKGKLE